MATAIIDLMTAAEFEALPPDDSVERQLIRGELREKPMTRRNRFHARIELRIGHLLASWIDEHPELNLEAYSGEVGCILQRDPDTTVGVDVLVASTELEENADLSGTRMLDGVPLLAVEILSPNDTQLEISKKIQLYLEVGVPLVWVISPEFETVDVYRPDIEPERFNVKQELSGEPHLPGLTIPVSQIFRRQSSTEIKG